MLNTFRINAGIRFLVAELVLIGVIIAAGGKLSTRESTQPSIPGDFAAAAVLPNYRDAKPDSAYRQARDSPRKGTRAALPRQRVRVPAQSSQPAITFHRA
jgi:hypothetical protein